MANSLRAKLSKLRHDGHITDAEYQAFIKKMDGHETEIRNKTIDEFAERLKEESENMYGQKYVDVRVIDEIAMQMKGSGIDG